MRYWRTIRSVLLFASCMMLAKYGSAQVRAGVVVEDAAKNSEAEKAGIQQGDILLRWSRGDAKGEIQSPFDLSMIEIEQAPRGNVTLEGFRDAEKRLWTLGPDDWGIRARPNLPQNFLSTYV